MYKSNKYDKWKQGDKINVNDEIKIIDYFIDCELVIFTDDTDINTDELQ